MGKKVKTRKNEARIAFSWKRTCRWGNRLEVSQTRWREASICPAAESQHRSPPAHCLPFTAWAFQAFLRWVYGSCLPPPRHVPQSVVCTWLTCPRNTRVLKNLLASLLRIGPKICIYTNASSDSHTQSGLRISQRVNRDWQMAPSGK